MDTFKILSTDAALPKELIEFSTTNHINEAAVKAIYKLFKGSGTVDQVVYQIIIEFYNQGFFNEFKDTGIIDMK